MIVKPQGYDEARAFTGEFASLPAGCYVCVIKQASMVKTQNGRDQIAILFDIAVPSLKQQRRRTAAQSGRECISRSWTVPVCRSSKD